MFPAVDSGGIIVAHGSSDTGYFVGGHTASDASAINNNPAAGMPLTKLLGNRQSKIRIIYRIFAVSAAIDDLVPQLF